MNRSYGSGLSGNGRWGTETIPHAMNSLYPNGISSVVTQFSAEALNIFFQRIPCLDVLGPNYPLDEFLRKRHVSVFGQEVQQLELRRREHEALVAKVNFIGRWIDDKFTAIYRAFLTAVPG